MLVEDTSTKCRECGKPLVWLGHLKRGRDEGGLEEFRFGCDACKREYVYVDGRLSEKRKERDAQAESAAIIRSERDAVLSHRCPACGGPISDGRIGPTFGCLWCGEQYAVENGELVPKLEDRFLAKQRLRMSDFYAVQPKR